MNAYNFIMPILLFLFSCQQEVNNEVVSKPANKSEIVNEVMDCPDYLLQRKNDNLNVSILLDLSDRIELPNQQIKDSAYISSLAKVFNAHIKSKKLGLLYDKMEVFFEPVPLDKRINKMSELLKVSYVRGVSKNEWMPKTSKLYDSIPSEIYNLVKQKAGRKGYPGSDTWRFFKDHVKDYCIEECRRNILVVLTDGYMYYDGGEMQKGNKTSYLTPKTLRDLKLNNENWEEQMVKRDLGFITATNHLEDLEVLVIGITDQNKENPYAVDIIKAYWSDWLENMGVTSDRYKIKTADIPSSIEKVIYDFIKK